MHIHLVHSWFILTLGGCLGSLTPLHETQPESTDEGNWFESIQSELGGWQNVVESPANALETTLGLRLETRDGWGPFFIHTSPLAPSDDTSATAAYPPAQDFPSSEWECDVDSVFTRPGEVVILRKNCRVDHLPRLVDAEAYSGDFDVAAHFIERGDGSTDLELWIDNRLDVGIDRFRYVMRVAQDSLPDDPSDIRVLFGYDDYIEDPLSELRKSIDDIAWINQVGSFEGDTGHHFIRNRLKVSSMMSLHTPEWGFILHGTDPDNADPGWLVLGSIPGESDPSLSIEFGYEYALEGQYVAGNGTSLPIAIGPTLRARSLPAERPLESAWWEAVNAYRPFLEEETDLLPDVVLADAEPTAPWAEHCLFAAWNVGPPAEPGEPYDLSHFLDEFQSVVDTYSSVEGEPLVFCPLLWDFHTYGPREPRDEAVALLADLHRLADALDVEFHPGAYYLPFVADADRLEGHPLSAAIVYTAQGTPHEQGEGLVMVAQDHPALIEDVLSTLELEYELGIHWGYHDNPFREMVGWRPWTETNRARHVNTRTLIQKMTDRLNDLGGGIMTIEAGRLGLNAMQGGATGVSNTLFPGGQPSAFNDALFHDHHLTAFAGDVGGESYNFVYADSRSDAYMCAVWSSNPDLAGGDCPYVTGRVDNTDHMPHLAMSAVLGRSIIDPMPNLRDEMNNPYNPAWVKDALDAYQTTIRNAYWLRRDTPALRTGRLLPTPPSDAARVTFSSRRLTSKSPLAWEHGVTTRRVERFPTGVFEDREQPGTTVLVVGNPYASPSHATVRFTFDGREYRELMNAEVVGAEASYSEDDDQLIVEVTVPSLDFATVEFHTGPEAEAL